ncbi:MAG: MBL fold metallo-hydrolase [Planctomycetes bacterium]|nr:MBL fold metallo-hydrolase [Planctomycetota bacterium]
MIFRRFSVDPLAQVSYLVADGGEALVVDPQRDVLVYLDAAREAGLRIRWALATHVHADFVTGLADLHAATGASIVHGARFDGPFAGLRMADGECLQLGGLRVRAIETPGHTPESVCWLVERDDGPARLLSGDTLFVGDVGRPDLVAARGLAPDVMARALWHSLRERLASVPDDTEIWPAHGAGSACGSCIGDAASSTMGAERATNWAMVEDDRERFVARLIEAQRTAPHWFQRIAGINRAGPRPFEALEEPRAMDAGAVATAIAGGAVLLDVRSAMEHGAGHWPQALNIGLAPGDFEPWAANLIDAERDVVVHAAGPADAGRARIRLARVGLERVIGVTSALPKPARQLPQVSVRELAERLASGAVAQVIDVRRPAEYAAGHVPRAVAAELGPSLGANPALGSLDRDRPTAVICAGGYRSSAACGLLRDAGFRQLVNVAGGTRAWLASGLPAERA